MAAHEIPLDHTRTPSRRSSGKIGCPLWVGESAMHFDGARVAPGARCAEAIRATPTTANAVSPATTTRRPDPSSTLRILRPSGAPTAPLLDGVEQAFDARGDLGVRHPAEQRRREQPFGDRLDPRQRPWGERLAVVREQVDGWVMHTRLNALVPERQANGVAIGAFGEQDDGKVM